MKARAQGPDARTRVRGRGSGRRRESRRQANCIPAPSVASRRATACFSSSGVRILPCAVQPLVKFIAIFARQKGRGLRGMERVQVGTRLPADFQHVAKALRGDKGGRYAASLQQGVRADGRAMHDRKARFNQAVRQTFRNAGQHALRGIVRRGRQFAHRQTAVRVTNHQIGKGSSGIHANDSDALTKRLAARRIAYPRLYQAIQAWARRALNRPRMPPDNSIAISRAGTAAPERRRSASPAGTLRAGGLPARPVSRRQSAHCTRPAGRHIPPPRPIPRPFVRPTITSQNHRHPMPIPIPGSIGSTMLPPLGNVNAMCGQLPEDDGIHAKQRTDQDTKLPCRPAH